MLLILCVLCKLYYKIIFQEMTFYINMNDHLLLSSFDKLLVGLLYEGAVDALALRLLASCGGATRDSTFCQALFAMLRFFFVIISPHLLSVELIDRKRITPRFACYLRQAKIF